MQNNEKLYRIDPPDCGCTDCLTGYSKPLDVNNQLILAFINSGLVENASGMRVVRNVSFSVVPDNA